MTAHLLAADLGSLIQDSKRKNSELRSTAEKSLQDLKSIPLTSEVQLSADLARRPQFISPFLLACSTHNAKYGVTGVSSLQRLAVAKALPRDRLKDVLDAFQNCLHSNFETQLKILQALPSVVQNYPNEVQGALLSSALQICSALHASKHSAVSNTAAATLQQLVIAIFDRVTTEDGKALEIPTLAEVPSDDGPIAVRASALDAYRVFNDLNLLLSGEKPVFVQFHTIPLGSTLELIESILSNHRAIMTTHLEQIQILRTSLMPAIICLLSEKLTFSATVRTIRILALLLRNHIETMPSECEIALGFLNHMMDPDTSLTWKRALCLELFSALYAEPRLLLRIFQQYDEQDGKKNVIGDNLAHFVRLANENPALIGLGHHSTMPSTRATNAASEQAVAEAGALAGVIGGPMADSGSDRHVTGIGRSWSNPKTPCLEQLDKSEAPQLPDTYLYSLSLTCITNISESLAKFILPITVYDDGKRRKKRAEQGSAPEAGNPSEEPQSPLQRSRTQSFRKKMVPLNPISLVDHAASAHIKTSAAMVTGCWPAVLASCSTFLNATLDTEYYRALVRAIQKFAQVAGLLRLTTPRDAFLTTLGKAAIPSSMLLAHIASPKSPPLEQPGIFANAKGLLSVDSLVSQASSALDRSRRPSHEANTLSLGPRNLLCLRALLNLAIALGPILQSAWSIVFETLQVADRILASSKQIGTRPTSDDVADDSVVPVERFEAEISAVQAAARRLFESTTDFPHDDFVQILSALCGLLNDDRPLPSGDRTPTTPHRRTESISALTFNTEPSLRDAAFALHKIEDLVSVNVERLALAEPVESGWALLVDELMTFSVNDRNAITNRILAADVLSQVIRDVAELVSSLTERDAVQLRILAALYAQLACLRHDKQDTRVYGEAELRIHQITLEALSTVIEQCGETLNSGWASVFDSLDSVFVFDVADMHRMNSVKDLDNIDMQPVNVLSRSLARVAFSTIQLVCSDFLEVVPQTSLATLLDLLLKFARQPEDLNMSLTAITCFWNVSDFLLPRSDLTHLPQIAKHAHSSAEAVELVGRRAYEGSTAALWLLIPYNLCIATTDKRAELRDSAVQTVHRIFENSVDRMSANTWLFCLRSVIFGMTKLNSKAQHQARNASASCTELASWDVTTAAITKSLSRLLPQYMIKAGSLQTNDEAWSDLLDILSEYFQHGSHELASSILNMVAKVLTSTQAHGTLGESTLVKTADVWQQYYVHNEVWTTSQENNQEAFVAYAQAFQAIYRSASRFLPASQLVVMLSYLRDCVTLSDGQQYSSDVDSMSTFQSLVLESFAMVHTEDSQIPGLLLNMLSDLVALPYDEDSRANRAGPTYVALSKAAMLLIQKTITQHVAEPKIYESNAVLTALKTLTKPLEQKFTWQKEGRPPTLWQRATTTILDILEASIPHLSRVAADRSESIVEQVVTIVGAVVYPQALLDPAATKPDIDESFDIKAFQKLRDLIHPTISDPKIPDSLRRTYTRTLFLTSILYQPIPGEMPDLADAPLANLYKIRLGRTSLPTPSPRPEMSYTCLTELFALLTLHTSTPAQIKLAQAAAPYLILRAALPLRAYIADHPLRGRMPQSRAERRELLFVLEQLEKLESEPASIPDAPGLRVRSKGGKHLHRLFPLLVKMLKVAREDVDVFEAVVSLVDRVSGEFGVEAVDEEEGEE